MAYILSNSLILLCEETIHTNLAFSNLKDESHMLDYLFVGAYNAYNPDQLSVSD